MDLVRPVAFALVTANLVNVFGNWVLIFGNLGFPEMGIKGAAISTLLTLLIVPASFSLADGIEKRIGPWLGYYLTNHGEKPIEKPKSLVPGWMRRRFGRRGAAIEPAE